MVKPRKEQNMRLVQRDFHGIDRLQRNVSVARAAIRAYHRDNPGIDDTHRQRLVRILDDAVARLDAVLAHPPMAVEP